MRVKLVSNYYYSRFMVLRTWLTINAKITNINTKMMFVVNECHGDVFWFSVAASSGTPPLAIARFSLFACSLLFAVFVAFWASFRLATRSLASATTSGNSSQKISFFKLNSSEFSAKRRFSFNVLSHEPSVGVVSSMKLSRPVRMVEILHAGFQVSGWKSLILRHSLKLIEMKF